MDIVNYCHQFTTNFSTKTEPLRRLTKKNQKFIWGKEQKEAFQKLKQKLTSTEIMCYYNTNVETNIVVDTRPKGLGAILSQKQKNGHFKTISYTSRALMDVESRYSQTEKKLWQVHGHSNITIVTYMTDM